VTEPYFDLRGIGFAYEPDWPVLRDVSFSLEPHERVALTGENGAGKTTLLHIMIGLLKQQAGEVVAFGSNRRDEKDFWDVRTRAGLLFQDPDDQLFCPTVAEDVAFGPLNLGKGRAEAHEIVRDTLASLGLSGFEERITHKLSGGEKRLVTLATVLAMDPQVLLLDEPTNALDEKARDRLTQILASLPQAMVIVSHDRAFRDILKTREFNLQNGQAKRS